MKKICRFYNVQDCEPDCPHRKKHDHSEACELKCAQVEGQRCTGLRRERGRASEVDNG